MASRIGSSRPPWLTWVQEEVRIEDWWIFCHFSFLKSNVKILYRHTSSLCSPSLCTLRWRRLQKTFERMGHKKPVREPWTGSLRPPPPSQPALQDQDCDVWLSLRIRACRLNAPSAAWRDHENNLSENRWSPESYELFLIWQKCIHQWICTSLYLRTVWEGFRAGLGVCSLLFYNTFLIFLNFLL